MSTAIEWADQTINPVVGCSKCSPGCDHCYAERFAARLAKNPQTAAKYAGIVGDDGKWTGNLSTLDVTVFDRLPQKPQRVFVGSMTDLFFAGLDDHGSRGITTSCGKYVELSPNTMHGRIAMILGQIAKYRQHTFLLLTKRPEGMSEALGLLLRRPLPNLWLGVTVCNQQEADENIPVLLDTPAAKRFVSIEPMLDAVKIGQYLYGSYECALSCGKRLAVDDSPELQCTKCGFTGPDNYETWGDGDCAACPKCGQDGCCGEIEEVCPDCGTYMVQAHPDTQYIDWVICGGETGPGARPMHPDWVRGLRDQCQAARVPFFFKGWGDLVTENQSPEDIVLPGFSIVPHGWKGRKYEDSVFRVGKRRAGRLLDGREWNEVPS